MNDISIRRMQADELPQFKEWISAHKGVSLPDFDILKRFQVRVYVAEDQTGVLCYIPVRLDLHYDAIAPRPDIAPFRLAKAFRQMNDFLVKQAKNDNIPRIVAEPSDAKFSEFLRQELGFYKNEREILEYNVNKDTTETAKCAE